MPSPSDHPEVSGSAPPVESNPVVLRVQELLAVGEYASAVRDGFRSAVEDTVRAFGLVVPPSRTDRQIVTVMLRPDMGKLPDLLPRLYELYEPVRFGGLSKGDGGPLLAVLRTLYAETALARICDPRFQPQGPAAGSPTKLTFSVVGRAPRFEMESR
ncbi:MAG: hypothetical protein WB809_05830 [Thermoplasmata archaeon]